MRFAYVTFCFYAAPIFLSSSWHTDCVTKQNKKQSWKSFWKLKMWGLIQLSSGKKWGTPTCRQGITVLTYRDNHLWPWSHLSSTILYFWLNSIHGVVVSVCIQIICSWVHLILVTALEMTNSWIGTETVIFCSPGLWNDKVVYLFRQKKIYQIIFLLDIINAFTFFQYSLFAILHWHKNIKGMVYIIFLILYFWCFEKKLMLVPIKCVFVKACSIWG